MLPLFVGPKHLVTWTNSMPASPDYTAKIPVSDLVAEGTRLIKSYAALHGKESTLVKSIAVVVVRLRAHHMDKNGRPDFRGRSQAYRDTVAKTYADAGIQPDAASNLQALVRHYISGVLREYMTANGYGPEDFEYYGLKADSAAERHKARERAKTAAAKSSAVLSAADLVDRDDLPGSSLRVIRQAREDLAVVAGDAEILNATAGLRPKDHKQLVATLDELEQFIAAIRASM